MKELWILGFALLGLTAVGAACLYLTLHPSTPEAEKKWAMSVLAIIVSLAVGYSLHQPRKSD